jgi:small subunit ribosomal protein S17
MRNSVVVKREFLEYIPKYERYAKKSSKITAHNPLCINAKVGDTVKFSECRPISKTKSFVIIEVI